MASMTLGARMDLARSDLSKKSTPQISLPVREERADSEPAPSSSACLSESGRIHDTAGRRSSTLAPEVSLLERRNA
jgi:hypothetical protein